VSDDPLPKADCLVVTWTVEEAKALADVLTPGYPSKTAWYHYAHNFTTKFVPIIRKRAPAVEVPPSGQLLRHPHRRQARSLRQV
jgi:hypothetical protein